MPLLIGLGIVIWQKCCQPLSFHSFSCGNQGERDSSLAVRATRAWVSTFSTMWRKLVSRREESSYERQRYEESRQLSTYLWALPCLSWIHARFPYILTANSLRPTKLVSLIWAFVLCKLMNLDELNLIQVVGLTVIEVWLSQWSKPLVVEWIASNVFLIRRN